MRIDGSLHVAIAEYEQGFQLTIGPLATGGGRRLVDDAQLPGLGCLLERLTDAVEIEPLPVRGSAELLRVRLDARGS